MTDKTDPERALALSYAPLAGRAGLAALLELDETLGQILRTTREPVVGQMRLTWWHQALTALDTAPPPAQPVLQALAAEVLPRGVSGARLAGLIDGWEVLLGADPIAETDVIAHGKRRGAALFEAAGAVLACPPADRIAAAGAGWALADLATHLSDVQVAARAAALAQAKLDEAMDGRWSRAGRALGALALVARMNLADRGAPAAPGRVARLAWHRLTGR
ncbi:squalene/phytoene synthase family protein [Sphingomonas sp. MMS24-J45]|uniref:squalene/phytoene synthase family protein n=1 Tax=Sphingomonas sp. MMS24-J45 TaxID=3238806 RepID=UPI00384C8700